MQHLSMGVIVDILSFPSTIAGGLAPGPVLQKCISQVIDQFSRPIYGEIFTDRSDDDTMMK